MTSHICAIRVDGNICVNMILFSLAVYLLSASVSSVFLLLYIYSKNFWLHPFLYLLVSWAWWDWPLTWLTKNCPSVLWCCWLSRKIIRKMTYITYQVGHRTLLYYTWCCALSCFCLVLEIIDILVALSVLFLHKCASKDVRKVLS